MQTLLLGIDRLSRLLGHLFAWCIVALTLIVSWEVAARRLYGTPHAWVFDAAYMLYGTLFMMAGAYALATGAHVRGDVLYGFFPPRVQASLDLLLYLVFFVPGVVALCYAGWSFAAESFAIGEHSSISADGPPIYPFKAVIPLAGATLLLQGLAEIVRCVLCLHLGRWPSRSDDVEEVDVARLMAQVGPAQGNAP